MPAIIERQWGREALLGVRDLELSAETVYKDEHKTICKEFREFVAILNERSYWVEAVGGSLVAE